MPNQQSNYERLGKVLNWLRENGWIDRFCEKDHEAVNVIHRSLWVFIDQVIDKQAASDWSSVIHQRLSERMQRYTQNQKDHLNFKGISPAFWIYVKTTVEWIIRDLRRTQPRTTSLDFWDSRSEMAWCSDITNELLDCEQSWQSECAIPMSGVVEPNANEPESGDVLQDGEAWLFDLLDDLDECDSEIASDLKNFLKESLSEKECKVIVVRAYHPNLSDRDIAEALGVPYRTIRGTVYRVKKKAARLLPKYKP